MCRGTQGLWLAGLPLPSAPLSRVQPGLQGSQRERQEVSSGSRLCGDEKLEGGAEEAEPQGTVPGPRRRKLFFLPLPKLPVPSRGLRPGPSCFLQVGKKNASEGNILIFPSFLIPPLSSSVLSRLEQNSLPRPQAVLRSQAWWFMPVTPASRKPAQTTG